MKRIAAQFTDVTSHVLCIIFVFKSAQYGELKQCPVTLVAVWLVVPFPWPAVSLFL